jgi:hypothetical protein
VARSAAPSLLRAGLADRVAEADQVAIEYDDADPDDLGGVEGVPGVSMAFAIHAAWISGVREELDTPDIADTVLDWITTHLGEPAAGLARRAAGILSAPDAPDLTVNQLADDLGPDFIPARRPAPPSCLDLRRRSATQALMSLSAWNISLRVGRPSGGAHACRAGHGTSATRMFGGPAGRRATRRLPR